MKYDVFISYSRKDAHTADKICEAFAKEGISYFIDRQGIGGGFEFPVVLAEAILESRVVLFLASVNSYDSKFTNAELTFAFNEKPKNSILPYIIDGSKMPPALRFVFASINWRTIENNPIEPVLVNDILSMLGRPRREVRNLLPTKVLSPVQSPESISNADSTYNVVLVNPGAAKLGCVKCIKELTGYGLKEAKMLADKVPSIVLRGVSMVEARKAVADLEDVGATVEIRSSSTAYSTYNVVLVNPGAAKLGCVKCIKELTGYGLKEAKMLVDKVPSIVLRGVSLVEARKAVADLEDVGATVEIRSSSSAYSTYVVLVNPGAAKLGCVKCIKELTGYGLKEAKMLVDKVPSIVLRGVSLVEARKAVADLEDVGATVEIYTL